MIKTRRQAGFTVIELLLAMAIFSFVMVTIIVAFTQIMSSYRQGVASQRTQEATRELNSSLSRDARTAEDVEFIIDVGLSNSYLCFDDIQYQFNSQEGSLVRGDSQQGAACTVPITGTTTDLIGDKLVITKFDVNVISNPTSSKTLGINVDYIIATDNREADGSGGLLKPDGSQCDASLSGSQFCSTSRLLTSIGLRGDGVSQ